MISPALPIRRFVVTLLWIIQYTWQSCTTTMPNSFVPRLTRHMGSYFQQHSHNFICGSDLLYMYIIRQVISCLSQHQPNNTYLFRKPRGSHRFTHTQLEKEGVISETRGIPMSKYVCIHWVPCVANMHWAGGACWLSLFGSLAGEALWRTHCTRRSQGYTPSPWLTKVSKMEGCFSVGYLPREVLGWLSVIPLNNFSLFQPTLKIHV